MASRVIKVQIDGIDLVVSFNYTDEDGYDIKEIDYRGVCNGWVVAYTTKLEGKIIKELDKIREREREDAELDAAILM
jgi:hypothetical protein